VRRYAVANGCGRLVTLTYREGQHDRAAVKADWSGFARKLRARWPDLAWVRVLELHPGGHGWHIHAAVSRYVPKAELAALWGRGFVDVRRLRSGSGPASREDARRAARYVAKYVAKAWADGDRRPGEHAYEVAQGHAPALERLSAWGREGAVLAAVAVMGGELPAYRWDSDASEDWRGPPVVFAAWP